MARKTQEHFVRLRERKLKDGGSSFYLDIYYEGKRTYEPVLGEDKKSLKLKTGNDKLTKAYNAKVRREAENARSNRENEIETTGKVSKVGKVKHMKMVDVITAYLKEKEDEGRRPSTMANLNHLKHRVEAFDKDVRLVDADEAWLKRFKSHLEADGLTGTTIHGMFVNLSSVYKMCVAKGYISMSPTARLKDKPKMDTKSREYLTPDELSRLIKTEIKSGSKYDIRGAFLFACFCGLRYSDISDLKWQNIIIKTDENGSPQTHVIKHQVKTGNLVDVVLGEMAKQWLPKRPASAKDDDKIFPTSDDIHFVGGYMKRWCAAAGITKHITFHCSRHTFATLMLRSGSSLLVTSGSLGHTNIKTTQIYSHLLDAERSDAARNLDKMFK